ncbi:hypothetical protein, partial [Vibrio sp. 10N.222.46.A1]
LEGLDKDLANKFEQPTFQFKLIEFGPSPASKIEARISGADPQILRSIAVEVEDILLADPGSRNVRHDWRE